MRGDFRLPPRDIPPEKLFRLMARTPRPVVPIDHRVRGAPTVALSVRALLRVEEQALHDATDGLEEQLQQGRRLAWYAAASLLANSKVAFSSPEEAQALLLGRLESDEILALEDALYSALSIVSPNSTRSDTTAWEKQLEIGAQHGSNIRTAGEMFETCDWVAATKNVRIPRPERYYGIPTVQLTEGQKMVYTAACRAVEKQGGR